jgi:hypothetical protein
MYLQNKFSYYYYNIINKAKSRDLPKEIYTEKHHIIPKSLGGDNSDSNIVKLTAREHFICHLLLTKMVTGKSKRSMTFAVWSMTNLDHSTSQGRYKITSHRYAILKKQVSEASSNLHKGKKVSQKTKDLQSEAKKGKPSTFKGKHHTDESKKLLASYRSKPCVSPCGNTYASTKEAGIAYNISGSAIRGNIERGVSGWKYLNNEDQMLAESKRKPKKVMKGVTQSTTHIENRTKSRLSNQDYYKDRAATIERMSVAAKSRHKQ